MEYVTFEIAKKLKEKGFNEPCYAFYTEQGSLQWNNIDTYYRPNQEISLEDLTQTYNNGNSICSPDAPTISQVLKWLREEKKLIVEPSLFKAGYEAFVQSTIFEDDKDYTDAWRIKGFYTTYEQAALAGIEYVLDNLI